MHMDFSTFLTILGLIATVIFGILSIDLFKRKRNPGKLTLVRQSTLGLFNNISKNFEEISILYKAEPIKENVIYLKASFINDGDIDIEGKAVEKTLNLELEKDLKWIKSKVTQTSPELISTSEILEDKQNLRFNFGLIRKREFFQFEALIETNNSKIDADDIYDKIRISHRISNTQKVNVTSLLSEEQLDRKKKKMISFVFASGFQLLAVIVFILVQHLYFKDAPIFYKGSDGNSYLVKAKTDASIQLKNIVSKQKTAISLAEFQKPEEFKPFIPTQTFWEKIESTAYMIPLLIILMLLIIGSEYWELRKSKKYYMLFDVKEKNIPNSKI